MPVLAQNNSEGESMVIALEKSRNQAYRLRDGKALSALLHDSLVLVNDDGSLQSKSGFLTGIDKAKPSANQQENPESIKVRFFGNVAIATGVFRQSGVENGKAFVRRNRFVDTWIHNGNLWQCVAASATPILQ
jgi:ketosteroid isomerase-like protein